MVNYKYCVSGSSYFYIAFFTDLTWLLDRKFNEDFKNVLKTVIFSLQVGFTGDFVLDSSFKLCFWQFELWHRFAPWLYQIVYCFSGYSIGNLRRISKMCLK